MKKVIRLLAMILSLCLVFSLTAYAGLEIIVPEEETAGETLEAGGESAGAPMEAGGESAGEPGGPAGEPGGSEGMEGGPGGPGGDSGGDSAMAMNADAAAAGTIFSVSEEGLIVDEEAGEYELNGEASETEAAGIDLHINTFSTNGFKVNGGSYTIKDSTIFADVTEKVDANAAGGYCAGVSDGILTLENCNFTTAGKGGRNGNYTVYCDGTGILVVINSNIIQTGLTGDPNGYTMDIQDPPSNAALGISGYARANMSLGQGQTYYYGSYVETEGWAAMSTDSARSGFQFFSYDSIGKALYGGYGTYADTSCVDWFYASVLSSPEIGAIISNNGEIHMAGGDAATPEALVYLPEDYEVSESYKANNGRSVVEAGRNDFQLHSPDMMGSGAGSDYHAVLELADTDISTTMELDANATLVDWYEDYGPAMGEYIDFVKGANILVKSTGAYIDLTNVTAESYSNVLLLTAVNSDSMSRYAKAADDMTGKGTELTIHDCDIAGDVDHYDYQRNTVVTLDNSTWSGAYVTISKDSWDAMWSDDCKADSSCYWILDPSVYFDGTGTTSSMIMDASSVWNVTGTSNITSLTVEAGAVINGVVTVNGEEVDISEGGTWEGDIIVNCAGDVPADEAPEAGDPANGDSAEGESAEGESAGAAPEAGDPANGESAEGESAEGESGGGSGEGSGGGPGGGGQEFGTFNEIAASAGIIIEDGTVTYAQDWDGTVSGDITAQGMKNAHITANEANGVAITLPAETDTYVIEDSEIIATAGQKNNELGYEAAFGVGVGVETGELWIKNSHISSEGPRSTPVYLHSTAQPEATSLVVIDSEISSYTDMADVWMPPFKLLAGGSRATLLMTRNNSWFINSTVTSNNWGAISQDSVDANTYVVNSKGISMSGGYGTYLTFTMYLYASQLYGGQYGAFMCGTSLLQTGTAEDAMADAEMMSKTPDYVAQEEPTVIAGPFHAVVVHTSTPGLDKVAVGNFKDAILSTMPEDLPESVTPMAADDAFFMNTEMNDFGISSGTAYFYNKNLYGSLILVRSMNTDFTFDNTDARTSNGVLVQTVLNYDPPQAIGYLSVGEGENLPGSKVTFLNGEYTGDILHQDYQHRMEVIVGENSTLNGAIVSGTYQGWNDLWSEETMLSVLEADGYAEIPFTNEDWAAAVQENLILADDAAYADTENLGADVTVTAGGTWIVTDTSTLSSLTLEEGAAVIAPDGMNLTVFADADASNSNSSYEGGTEIEELAAGTYENVIITVF